MFFRLNLFFPFPSEIFARGDGLEGELCVMHVLCPYALSDMLLLFRVLNVEFSF